MSVAAKDGPFDQGWAWFIMIGGSLWNCVFIGTYKSFGLFYVEFQDWFQCSPAEASIVGLISGIMFIISAPLSGLVGDYGNIRLTTFCCGLLAALGIIATSQVSSLGMAAFFYGCVTGLTSSIIDVPVLAMVGKYFKKYRTFATGVMFAGASLGTLVLPQIFAAAKGAYGPRMAMLLLGGVWLHACVVGALMRPLQFKVEVEELHIDLQNNHNSDLREKTELYSEQRQLERVNTRDSDQNGSARPQENHEPTTSDGQYSLSPVLKYSEQCGYNPPNVSACFKTEGGKGNGGMEEREDGEEMEQLAQTDKKQSEESGTLSEKRGRDKGGESTGRGAAINSRSQHVIQILKSYVGLLKNVGFMVRMTSINLACLSYVLPLIAIPPLCHEMNINTSRTANLISTLAIIELFGRLILSFLIEKFKCPPVLAILVSAISNAATSIAVINYPVYNMVMIFSCFHGLVGGVAMVFMNTLLCEAVDVSQLGRALGIFGILFGVISAILTPIIGLIKEQTGSHLHVFSVSASAAILGISLYAGRLCIEKRSKKPDTSTQNVSL